MKCQHCEKPATFHITELTEPDGPSSLHLCEDHAKAYLTQSAEQGTAAALAGMLAKQLKIEETVQKLSEADKKTCPACGITFGEFRQGGRLGCAYDYIHFQEELEPLLLNIHGATQHSGKQPTRMSGSPDRQHRLFQLRREMKTAVDKEQYEKASQLRDEIKKLEEE